MSLPTAPLPKHLLETFRKLEAYYEPMKTSVYLCYCLVHMEVAKESLRITPDESAQAMRWIEEAIKSEAVRQGLALPCHYLDGLFPGPTYEVPVIIQRRKDWLRYLLAPYE